MDRKTPSDKPTALKKTKYLMKKINLNRNRINGNKIAYRF